MATALSLGTPLAEALSNVVQPKLVEMGWSADGGEDSALTEYVILMLANGKTQDQIAEELSNDLLNLGEGDTQALDFSKWLFEQVDVLNRQLDENTAVSNQSPAVQAIPSFMDSGISGTESILPGSGQPDSEVGDAVVRGDLIPTGPRAMRNGRQTSRGRLLSQINKTMDRGNDLTLHRVRGQPGTGRIHPHIRDQSKASRPQHGGGRMGVNRQIGGMGPIMPGGQIHSGSPAGNLMHMSPQNQMQLMALLEEQARFMAQLMPGIISPAVNPAFQPTVQPQQGRSLFERVERQQQSQHPSGGFIEREAQNGISVNSPEHEAVTEDDMDTKPEPLLGNGESTEGNTGGVCKFNLRCTKRDCPFAHQSPSAPEGTLVDITDHCPFGAACKNKKCTGNHPSPALKVSHQAEELCRFFPHCTNPQCSFKHPSMPLCRNGADCTVPGCKFTHLQTSCKYHPCLNRNCLYKHVEGQRGAFADRVWTAGSNDQNEKPHAHVSERKFIEDENAEEELIKAGIGTESSLNQELVT